MVSSVDNQSSNHSRDISFHNSSFQYLYQEYRKIDRYILAVLETLYLKHLGQLFWYFIVCLSPVEDEVTTGLNQQKYKWETRGIWGNCGKQLDGCFQQRKGKIKGMQWGYGRRKLQDNGNQSCIKVHWGIAKNRVKLHSLTIEMKIICNYFSSISRSLITFFTSFSCLGLNHFFRKFDRFLYRNSMESLKWVMKTLWNCFNKFNDQKKSVDS